MAFRDLDEFLVVPPLVLPIRGKRYEFPGEISARNWLRLQRLYGQARQVADGGELDLDEEVVSRTEQRELEAEMYGDAEARMVADGCTGSQVKAVLVTVTQFYLEGREAAELVWESQGEAPAPNRETRRSKTPAKSTRSRGSRTGSTARAKPKASAGKTSSPSGTSSKPT